MSGRQSPKNQKIARLQEAIEKIASGETQGEEPLVDREYERAVAPVAAKANRLINHRPRSEHELRTRLLEADFPPELVEEVISRCLNNGMVDDATFAREWVRQRAEHNKKSVSVLRQELKQKGIAGYIAEEALSTVDEDDQQAIMKGLIDKKARGMKTPPQDRKEYDKALRRIVGVAARRGFPEGQALGYAREALEARIAEIEP